jgi:hypothetical protein
MPGLEVDRIGTVRLPLGAAQARKLIAQCVQAPYGKGVQTVVDTKVRRVWELDPRRFKLTNPRWEELIETIVAQVREALGLSDRKLGAHLYKLLLYEKGSFFLPHRDGEKLDGMVATLVVALPSPHTGGELIVTHEGRRHELALSGAASGHELSYAAFYADCEHEVRPVQSGYRLCLAYNLTLARARSKKGIAAPRVGPATKALGELLSRWPEDGVEKVAVALDHQYSEKGLRIDALKGVDRARAEVLFDAAEQAGCTAHLALITHWQNGSAEGGDYGYGGRDRYHSRKRYGRWTDDEDEDDDDGGGDSLSGYDMGEVYDESATIDCWSDRNGRRVRLGAMDLEDGELVCSEPLEEWDISREEFGGYTGNAGMTLDRWYHRAAIVIWPREGHFRVLCQAGTDAAIAGLEKAVKQWKRAKKADREALRRECERFARAILDTWSPQQKFRFLRYSDGKEEEPLDHSLVARLLMELEDPALVRQYLVEVMPRDGDAALDESFAAFAQRHGWETFALALTRLLDESTAETIARNAALLELLCRKRDKDAGRIELCRPLAERAVAALEKLDAAPPSQDWRAPAIDRAALLVTLVKSALAVEAPDALDRLVGHVLAAQHRYDLTDVHLKAIFALAPRLRGKSSVRAPALGRWLAWCRAELERRTAQAPRPPADHRRPANISCACGDCRDLRRFLDDAHEAVHRFPVAQHRRQPAGRSAMGQTMPLRAKGRGSAARLATFTARRVPAYSTVTLLARFRGLSTSQPRSTAM